MLELAGDLFSKSDKDYFVVVQLKWGIKTEFPPGYQLRQLIPFSSRSRMYCFINGEKIRVTKELAIASLVGVAASSINSCWQSCRIWQVNKPGA